MNLKLLLCLAAAAAACPALALPSFGEVKSGYVPSDAWLLARDGTPLQSLRIDRQVRRLPWTPLAETSPALVRAVVVSEDKRFFEHGGVDWRAIGSAAWSNIAGSGSTRGASTLTMQLAGLIDDDVRRRGRRSVFEKATQAAVALRIETSWTKRQIVEAYLNLVPFRGELQGVAAASRSLFGKWPGGLDEREAAIAAALLRAPNASPALVARRACGLLKEMQRASECEGLEGLAADALAGTQREGGEPLDHAAHLARKLLSEPGQKLKSTLDADLQSFAVGSLRRHLSALARQNAQDGAVLVLDNASGEVLAWVGSSGELSDAADVDGVVAPRQAGSTLKPFLYALAFETRQLTPASLIEDAPLTLDTGNGLYVPQDYEPNYRGWVSARMALAGSLNVPAVRTLVRLGPDAFYRRLHLVGMETLKESADWYGYSLALGSADVTLLQLANGYRTIANGGRWSPLRLTSDRKAPACRQDSCASAFAGSPHAAYAPGATFLVADVLSDRAARAGTFGLESWLATPYWAAAKTGTSKDMRDNWCVGFSRRYTVAVWVGNASGEPMHDVSGVSGAAPVWRDVMDRLHRGDAATGRAGARSVPPAPPAGVMRTRLRFDPPREPPRQEWFLAGTQTDVVRAARRKALARISYPTDGTIIALDPDIPPPLQRVPLRLSAEALPGWRWRMDGQNIGRASQPLLWLPRPGRHRVSIDDTKGHEVDVASFEVRALKGGR